MGTNAPNVANKLNTMSMYVKNILETIGNTPLVELTHTDTGLCRLFVKLENQNPGGSIKDRVGLSMINFAEREGKIKPGDTIVEATAGNTGLGLALVSQLKGYKLLLVIPDKMSREKINHLRALGVEIIITRSDVGKGHPEYYQDYAERIARERGGYYINQFENPANPLAHETTTAPEIWQQMEHQVDAVVVGVGSSGTITGLSRFFSKVSPQTSFILADPQGSILADYINKGILTTEAGSWLVEGIGEDFVPSIADFSLTKQAYTISDKESFEAVHKLLRQEGILAGSSSGTLLSAAIKYCKAQTKPKRVVTFICDSGNKYLSKMYNDDWMQEQGFMNN
jgi:cystathionine beta-synthase